MHFAIFICFRTFEVEPNRRYYTNIYLKNITENEIYVYGYVFSITGDGIYRPILADVYSIKHSVLMCQKLGYDSFHQSSSRCRNS